MMFLRMGQPPQAVDIPAHLLLPQAQKNENNRQKDQEEPVPEKRAHHFRWELHRLGMLRAPPANGKPDDRHIREREDIESRRYLGALGWIGNPVTQEQIATVKQNANERG